MVLYEPGKESDKIKKNIKKLYINKELNDIGKYTLRKQDGEYKKIEFIQVETGNKKYFSDEVGFYSILKDGKKRLEYIFKHNITSYETPSDVIEFAPNAFQYCFHLQKIILGEDFKNWDERALPDVDNIKSIYIPKNVEKIQCKSIDYQIDNLLQYDIDEENEHFFRDEDCIYEVLKDGTYKLIRCMYIGRGNIVVLNGTSIIGKNAFENCEGFTQIELPDTVRVIEKEAFAYTALKGIRIPDNIKRIEKGAFCFCEHLSNIKVPSKIEDMAKDAFEGCDKLRKIESDKKSYQPEGDISNLIVVPYESQESRKELQSLQFFQLNKSSMKVEFKSSKKDKREEIETAVVPSFVNNTGVNIFNIEYIPNFIKKIVIPAQISKIENTEIALSDYETEYKIKSIEIAEENPNYYSDGYAIYTKNKEELIRFLNYTAEEYRICEETKRIRACAFKKMVHLKSLILPKMTEYIGDYAFANCQQLAEIIGIENVQEIGEGIVDSTKFKANHDVLIIAKALIKYKHTEETTIVVPNGVEKICNYAFWQKETNKLVEEIILPNTIKRIEKRALKELENLKSINIPNGVKIIEEGLFRDCYALEELKFPASIESIALDAFPKNYFAQEERRNKMRMHLRKITVSTENQNYCSVNGILFSKDKSILYYAPPYVECEKYIIPPEVRTIDKEAFYGNTNLNEVIFSEGNTVIEDLAFCYCRKLKKVKFSNSIIEIKEQAFNECELLAKIAWPANLKMIGDGAFRLTKLTEINLPDTLEYIGTSAFSLTRCEHVVLPKSVKKIGYGIFEGCKEIEIYDSIADTEKDCKSGLDLLNGYPNSLVGYIGIGKAWELRIHEYAVCNYRWLGYTIAVRSSEDNEIKYKVWTGIESSQSQYHNFLASAWGKNATFDFEFLDDFFPNIKGAYTKAKVAQYRLEYPVQLSQENKERYEAYLTTGKRSE